MEDLLSGLRLVPWWWEYVVPCGTLVFCWTLEPTAEAAGYTTRAVRARTQTWIISKVPS